MRYAICMAAFPLQEELIDAVIEFANTKLTDARVIRQIFAKTWKPDSVPSLATCRKIQSEVRVWLAGESQLLAIDAFAGGSRLSGSGIELVGRLGYQSETTFDESDPYPKPVARRAWITWRWRIKSASLRAVCGLAVATIEQAQGEGKIGPVAVCARAGCGRYFVDRSSRGIAREYCKTTECEKARNRERVSRSRGKP
jgi:hypothetical protein